MATFLTNSSLPLWVWIVIIVVGSVVILGTIAYIIRFIITRQRRASFVDTFGDENLPQRKITVRRGRVVEQSKYLSLTGSRFGLNAFGQEDNDASTRGGARSKSPFEWWANVKDRSQSRSSQITDGTYDNSSIRGAPTSPGHQQMYQRRDWNVSSSTLGSTMKDDVSVSVVEEPTSPPALVRNFSRSFSRQGHNSNFTSRIQTLSRIEESSPHTSMISERQSRIASYASKRDTKSSTSSPLPASPSLTAENLRRSSEQPISSKKSSLSQEVRNVPTYMLEHTTPMAYDGSRSSFGDNHGTFIRSSKENIAGGSNSSSRRQSQITALPEPVHARLRNDYWGNDPEPPHPVRSSSKKGKVLRKKSLKRSALVTQIDS